MNAGSPDSQPPEPAAPEQPPAGHAGGECILVVEDERHTRAALQRFLRKHGWNAVGFGTATEAQAWLNGAGAAEQGQARAQVAGAVIDVHLPDGDGIDLTRSMRSILGEGVPIVIVSGDTSMETLRRLKDAGGNRFVGKPMSLAALREALQPQR